MTHIYTCPTYVDNYNDTYSQAVAADARFLHALRSAVFLEVQTEVTLAAVLASTRLTLATSNPASSRSLTDTCLRLACLRRSSSRHSRLTSLWQLHRQITTTRQSDFTAGRIAAARGRFSSIRQVAPVCTPPNTWFLGPTESIT